MRKSLKAIAGSLCVAGLPLGLTACSTDSVVWGQEGAAVREATNQFVTANKEADDSPGLCNGSAADLGTPSAWEGLSAGEPAKFSAKDWEAYGSLSPTWVINLSHQSATRGAETKNVPVYLFFKGAGKDLCVAAIEWGEITSTS
ncbi:hypothetical protein [Microbacterium azadirachtae]|uniref:Lipoprotein n=1 Tax=Microbacterium azadirachtae TaxID=582680 RepID=A0A1I6G549_9MICO|nr:hypothetical protein [Microbacterium azadirachtae]SDL34520.1 hypothetical protein SAMN04488593_0774 [Microbacterium azadirachtae]SEF65037.1 hypothetical protein SAMN04488594_0764 [Microbacterium azadirachtae]SEF65878.1 hypothetical protein SAMN04488592_0773 [Microbacterium azadirachtae]SFR37319.1 hypothetical protein SAMN04488591_0769 [Microbacterium azadirachtae]